MALTLIVLNGPGKGQVFELDGAQPEVIGRAASRLRIRDTETSRRHAEIRCEKDTWIIRDLGSTNGTHVNGRRLTGLTELEEGDQVLVGRVLLVVGQITPTGVPASSPESVRSASDEPAVADSDRPTVTSAWEFGHQAPSSADEAEAPAVAEGDGSDAAPTAEAGPEPGDDPHAAGAIDLAVDADGEEAAMPPASRADVEQGFLAANGHLFDEAADLVHRERSATETHEDEHEPHDDVHADHGHEFDDEPLVAENDAAASAADEDAAEPLVPSPTEQEPRSPQNIDAAEDDPLAALAASATIEEDAWPDLELDWADETADAEGEPADVATDQVQLPPTPRQGRDALAELEADLDVAVSNDGDADAESAESEPGTGLVHHVGLASESGDAGHDTDRADDSGFMADFDADDDHELDALLVDEDNEALDPDGTTREIDAEAPPAEQGVNLADLIPHALDEERPPISSADEVAADPKEEPSEPSTEGHATAKQQDGADRPTQPSVTVLPLDAGDLAAPTSHRRRRGLLGVLLSCLALGGGVAGAWYAGLVDDEKLSAWLASRPPTATEPTPPNDFAAADAQPDLDLPPPTIAVPPTPRPSDAAPLSARSLANLAFSPPVNAWGLGDAPPVGALGDAPRLLGASVLDGRVVSGAALSPPSPAVEPDADATAPPAPLPSAAEKVAEAPAPGAEAEPQAAAASGPRVDVAPAEPAMEAELGRVAAEAVPAATPESSAEPPPPMPATVARRVAFLVDTSGAVLDSMDLVLASVRRAVDELGPSDRFTVIFFRRGEAIEAPPHGVRPANDETRRELQRWIEPQRGNVFPSGQSDPIAALERAVAYGVDEVRILTAGRNRSSDDAERMLSEADALLADRDVEVHAVEYFYRDPHAALRRLAERHEGTYQFLSPEFEPGPDPIEALNNLSAMPLGTPAAQ